MATDVPATGIKKKVGVATAGVAVAAVIGGGVWAGVSFFSQGAQPAQALPADTLAYAAVDLDPSGEQKIEAIRFLRKFPGIRDELDLGTDDDLKLRIFEEMQEEGVCEDLDYEDDIEPWLGDRAAAAGVDRGDEDPALVFVVQVKDEDEARAGFDKIVECSEADEDDAGVAFTGEWAVIAETTEIADEVVADAEESALSDNEDFQQLTEEAGAAGVLNLYVAPAAGPVLMEQFEEEMLGDLAAEFGGGEEGEEIAEELAKAFEEFPGVAGTLRFGGGDVEFELVTGQIDAETSKLLALGGDRAGEVATGLPASTAAVVAYSLPEGWGESLLEVFGPGIERDLGMPLDDGLAALEADTGLSIPEDVETLLGEGVALVLDDSVSAEAIEFWDPTMLPAGIRVLGDPAEIEKVLDKVRALIGPGFGELLVSESQGDYVAIGMNPEYVEKLAKGGDLGEQDVFQDVVTHPGDASVVYYIDFDANDWLDNLVGEFEDEDVVENVEPLSSFGASTWTEDDKGHLLLRLRVE